MADRLFRKDSVHEFQHRLKEVKEQLLEQLKCLEQRTDVQSAIIHEINDFLKKRMEIEMEYSKQIDKLVKSVMQKHKNEKNKRSNWSNWSFCNLWQTLVDDSREEVKQRNIAVETYTTQVIPNITLLSGSMQRISKKCREVCSLAQGEIIRVLQELQVAMKTYHLCYSQFNIFSAKLQRVEDKRNKSTNSSTRKQRSVQKSFVKKNEKYEAARIKCNRSRNEYLLCIEAANSALYKFFADDLSDIIDCSDLGLDYWIGQILSNIITARKSVCQTEMNSLAELGTFKDSFDTQVDKNKFFESNNSTFMLPRRFDFKCSSDESISAISVDSGLSEEFKQRQHQIKKRLCTLQSESNVTWCSMEQVERHIKELLKSSSSAFAIQPASEQLSSKVSTEEFELELTKSYDSYLQNFNFYVLNANLISRLEARSNEILKALASATLNKSEMDSFGSSELCGIENSLSSDQIIRKKRIGSQTSTTNSKEIAKFNSDRRRPRLFNGSLTEYVEATGEPIPLIVTSCIRVLSQFALQHQGLFRISGSQIEMSNYREAFENGVDPLIDVKDASDANSIASTLKLYLREQQPPLFPFYLFELLTDCAKCLSTSEFINKITPLLNKLPRPTYLLLRYLFGFLRHLSEFSDENMMDPYNIAICFGPTLLPIPDRKDQVVYQNSVNEVVKNLIVHYESVFNPRIPGPCYERYSTLTFADTPTDNMESDVFNETSFLALTPNEHNDDDDGYAKSMHIKNSVEEFPGLDKMAWSFCSSNPVREKPLFDPPPAFTAPFSSESTASNQPEKQFFNVLDHTPYYSSLNDCYTSANSIQDENPIHSAVYLTSANNIRPHNPESKSIFMNGESTSSQNIGSDIYSVIDRDRSDRIRIPVVPKPLSRTFSETEADDKLIDLSPMKSSLTSETRFPLKRPSNLYSYYPTAASTTYAPASSTIDNDNGHHLGAAKPLIVTTAVTIMTNSIKNSFKSVDKEGNVPIEVQKSVDENISTRQ